MFRMPERAPGADPSGSVSAVEKKWGRASAELAGVDGRVRSLRARGRITGADVRAARREARRVLREHCTHLPAPAPDPDGIGPEATTEARHGGASTAPAVGTTLCESCRVAAATARVVFTDGAVSAVCPRCAGGALAGVAA